MARKKHKPSKRESVYVINRDEVCEEPFRSGQCEKCQFRTDNNRCKAYTNELGTDWAKRVAYCRAIRECRKFIPIGVEYEEPPRPSKIRRPPTRAQILKHNKRAFKK